MTRLLAIALFAAACTPKNVQIREEPEWRTEAGQERVRIQLIESLIERGNGREALILIRTARDKGDDDLTLDLHQAAALHLTGMADESERLLMRYLSQRTRDERAWRRLGLIQADEGRPQDAIESFRRATELDAEHAPSWNNLGFLLLSQDRYEEAVDALQHALDLDGTNMRYRNNLGFALAGAGRTGDALQTFMSAALPADAHANMGLAFEMMDETQSAIEQYELAVQYQPNHAASNEALQRLTPPVETAP